MTGAPSIVLIGRLGVGCALASLLATGSAPPLAAQETISVDEVSRGQRGYGLSVFAGSEVERFDVEVIGVMRDVAPDTSYILARLSGQNLETTGVIAGMSGSPVFLDGRLAGAVAFAWPFSHEAIAGITPIDSMRALVDTTGSPPAAAAMHWPSGDGPTFSALLEPAHDLAPLEQTIASLFGSPLAGMGSPAVLWSASGLGERALSVLGRGLAPFSLSGSASSQPADLRRGAAVAGLLVDGDMRIAATGTVTDRIDESVLAFGHPFLGLGPIDLPMASAEIVTVLSNQLSSFKISNVGSVVGAFTLDRKAGIRGELGRLANTLPMTIEITGLTERRYELQLARVPQMAPVLVAISALSAIDSATQAAGVQGLDMTMRFALAKHGELEMRQAFDGPNAVIGGVVYALAVSAFLFDSPLADDEVESVALEFVQHPEPRTAQLVGAHANKAEVRPGETVSVNLDLNAYRDGPYRHSIDVEVPSDLPTGRYSLLVGDGVNVDIARFGVESAAPIRYEQVIDALRSLHSRSELVALGLFAGSGLAVAGEVLPQLPGSMRSMWEESAAGDVVPLRLVVAQEEVEQLDRPLAGIARIDLNVKRRAPLGATATSAGGDQGDAPATGGVETVGAMSTNEESESDGSNP